MEFTWKIENFSMVTLNEPLNSPQFHSPLLGGIGWFIELSKASDVLMFHICKGESIKNSQTLILDVVFELHTSKFHSARMLFFCPVGSEPFLLLDIPSKRLLLMEECLPNDRLTLRCMVRTRNMKVDSMTDDIHLKDETDTHPFLCPSSTFSLSEEFYTIEVEATNHIQKSYPSKCSACTHVKTHGFTIKWTINEFDKGCFKREASLIVPIKDDCLLLLTLYYNFTDDTGLSLQLTISRSLPDHKKWTFVRCVVMVMSTLINLPSINKSYLFENENDIFILPIVTKNQTAIVKEDDILTICCEISLCHEGEEYTVTKSKSLRRDSNKLCGVFKNDILNMYLRQMHCDVYLRTTNRIFGAHKNVMCARSPVFNAMFERDMEESKTNIVNIPDVDSQTVDRLLYFIYSSEVDRMEYDEVFKLYKAAHKYDIPTLIKMCTVILQDFLSVSNFCEIAAFAELYQDFSLIKTSKNFMLLHAEEISCTDDWKDLVKSNPSAAFEVIHDMLLTKLNPS